MLLFMNFHKLLQVKNDTSVNHFSFVYMPLLIPSFENFKSGESQEVIDLRS